MHNMTVQDVRLAVGGEWIRRPDDADGREAEDSARALPTTFGAVCTDTRRIVAGDIFVALKGDNFDGAEFLAQAQAKGARCIITQRIWNV